jgi:hypothetical protein
MKVFKFFCMIVGFTWIAHALLIIFNGHELSKLSSIVACANSVILYFMFALATYSYGGDK